MNFAPALLSAVIALVPVSSWAVQPERPDQESFLSRAVFADRRAWLLSDAGVVSTISEGADSAVRENLPQPVVDLCVKDDHILVVTGDRLKASDWTLRRWDNGSWAVAAHVPTEGDGLVALDCANNRVAVLTSRRLIDLSGDRPHAIPLSQPVAAGLVSSTYGGPDFFFVGLNAGEWGGGLRRIDRRTGAVTKIEQNSSGELCGGPLNSNCDPVNGLAAEPWKPGCIVAAIGLVHFTPHGRLVEVCGDTVKRLYFVPDDDAAFGGKNAAGIDGEPFSTVAFFGLAREGDVLWAVGTDGLYRVTATGVQSSPLPRFTKVSGFYVSFDLPRFVLILTNVNQRRSISGSTPMLVPR